MIDYGFEVVFFPSITTLSASVWAGWSAARRIKTVLKFSGYYSQGVEWYTQKAGVEALTNPAVKAEMQEYFRELKERRDLLIKGLNELGLKVEPPAATPYLWIQVPDGYDDEDFVLNTLINKAHVAFMPWSYFGECGKGYFRATLFLSRDRIEETLAGSTRSETGKLLIRVSY